MIFGLYFEVLDLHIQILTIQGKKNIEGCDFTLVK